MPLGTDKPTRQNESCRDPIPPRAVTDGDATVVLDRVAEPPTGLRPLLTSSTVVLAIL